VRGGVGTVSDDTRDLFVELDKELYRRLKVRAALEDRTLRSLVEEAVRRLLEEREAGKRA